MKYEVRSTKYEGLQAGGAFVLRPSSFVLSRGDRGGFTLTELLVVILIVGILTGLALAGLSGATELAREQRTRAIIAKLDQLVMDRYESYRTRAVPVPVSARQSAYGNPRQAAQNRLNALRELMRMELPDRRTDIIDYQSSPPTLQATATGIPQSSLQKKYYRMAARSLGALSNSQDLQNWSSTHESAECLYLIISSMHDGDKNALDFFSADEIGDVDEDNMKEILDGWGNPIAFIRWPAGYVEHPGPDGAWGITGTDDDGNGVTDDISEAGWPGSDDLKPQTMQTRNFLAAPDPFDPIKVDPRWGSATLPNPYALRPLIFSAGRDREYDITVEGGMVYRTTTPPNDPYYSGPAPGGPLALVGRYGDANGDGEFSYTDNITNHYQESP
jgi:prepilin-type N-terminal cleavage/methylation domain-containing protein